MKEYEYILMGMEEYLSHYNSMAICAENYTGLNFPNAFDCFFDKYVQISNRFQNNFSKKNDNNFFFIEKCVFRKKREDDLKLFLETINNLQSVNSGVSIDVDLNQIVKEYNEIVNNIKGHTLEDELLLYPFIINTIRDGEEKR